MIDILVILDRSGSMEDARSDHEGGLRSFVDDQRNMDGDVRLTFVRFDTGNPCEIVCDRMSIADVRRDSLELIPRGGTPLLDAIGRATSHLSERQAKEPSDATIAMVITDGAENSSREWTLARVKARVAELEKAGWRWLFLGAKIDAFAEGGAIGVSFNNTMRVGAAGVRAAYAATSSNLRAARIVAMHGGGWVGENANFCNAALTYSADQRAETARDDVSVSSASTTTSKE